MAQKRYGLEAKKLLDVLSRKTVEYHPDCVTELQGVPAALILGNLLYWSDKQGDPGGWFRKSAEEMERETTVPERRQVFIRAMFATIGIIDWDRRGLPATGHYKVNHERIADLLHEQGKLATGGLT